MSKLPESCFWIRDEDGFDCLIPRCMGSLQDPTMCTCKREAMESERVRTKHEDEIRALRRQLAALQARPATRLLSFAELQDWKERTKAGAHRANERMRRTLVGLRHHRNVWMDVATHWRERARAAGDTGPEHPSTVWEGERTYKHLTSHDRCGSEP